MKRFVLLLALLLAVPAAAQPYPTPGTWTYGDDLFPLYVHLTGSAGAAVDVTGATLTLYATTTVGATSWSFTIDGAIVDATNGDVRFDAVGTTARDPKARGTDFYEAQVRIFQGGRTGWSQPFRFAVRRAPH